MTRKITVLDLFAGAGGLTAGLHAASDRFQAIGAVEIDHAAAASYGATYGEGLLYVGDIRSWLTESGVPRADLLVGGPPCQGFSSLGKRDEEDERNTLWMEYAQTIRASNPKFFVVENVAEFKRSPQYELFRRETEPGGLISDYAFEADVLNAADYGVPQLRKRTVLIGHHRDLDFPGMPIPTHTANPTGPELRPHVTVAEALRGVPREPDRDERFESKRIEFMGRTYPGAFGIRDLHLNRKYTDLSKRRFAVIPAGGSRRDLEAHPELMSPCWVKHKTGAGDVMGRMHWDRPSVTIRTEFFKPEKGRYLHPEEDRAITHYEGALLQGFGSNHRFVGSRTAIARQIGNAVPVQLGAAIGRLLEPLI